MSFLSSKILVHDMLYPEAMHVTVSKSNLTLTSAIEKRIEEIWQEKLIESKERGNQIFNGESYRVNFWSFKQSTLNLDLSIYDYKHRLGLITMIGSGEISAAKYPHNGCFVGATVLTADGYYVMVKLSGKSMNKNTIEMLGGMVETETSFSSQDFLFTVLYQELQEEADIKKADILDCHLQAMFTGGTSHFGFYFVVSLGISSTELQNRFANNQDIDIESLVFLDKDTYLETLRGMSENKRLIASLVK